METRNVLFAIILSTIVIFFFNSLNTPVIEKQNSENEVSKNQNSTSPSIDDDEKETLQNSINKFILDELKLMEFQRMLSLRNISNRVLENFAVEAIGEQNIFSEAYISKMERFSSETNPIKLDHKSAEGFFLSSDETITNVRINITLE